MSWLRDSIRAFLERGDRLLLALCLLASGFGLVLIYSATRYMDAAAGMRCAVLSRELSRDQIAYICQNSPIEIEVFGHGALCMCYSGQCYLSSLIGGRSGNRGLCAQPCRLKYGWGKRADEYPLSLKDMSLVGYLKELEDMGVACLKLEGRMKRPEYVAIVTRVYADALREGREPTAEELRQLEMEDIDKAMYKALDDSMTFVKKGNKPLDSMSAAAWEDFRKLLAARG